MVTALKGKKYRTLLALRKEEQVRYKHVFDTVIGSKPTFEAEGVIEYCQGFFRIDADVPQESLLQSGKVALFVSHMGFGGYTEAINGGVPMVAYPSGCDQWYNCQRAVEAGVAVQANPQMKGLDLQVMKTVENDAIKMRSKQLASEARELATNKIILDHADDVAAGDDGCCCCWWRDTCDSVSSCSTSNESLSD